LPDCPIARLPDCPIARLPDCDSCLKLPKAILSLEFAGFWRFFQSLRLFYHRLIKGSRGGRKIRNEELGMRNKEKRIVSCFANCYLLIAN